MVVITSVVCGSYASKAGIMAGDLLVSINGNDINDILDYRFYLTEKTVELNLKRDEASFQVCIIKDEYDDIGLEFSTGLMDQKQSCKNKCIFCFIDQLPRGMRDTLYFKDDDSRLSFLHGNYVTLTNMTDSDIDRIIKMHISPINVSIHTTNPDLRVFMMKNKRAGEVLSYLDRLSSAKIKLHAQIVLCKNINDSTELERSLTDMLEYYPSLESLSVVPSGLTKFRDGLYPLEEFTAKDSKEVIELVDRVASIAKDRFGTRLFYCADEFYLKADMDIPPSEYYEEYMQIENGVGMIRSLLDEFYSELDYIDEYSTKSISRKISIATGVASYPFIKRISTELSSRIKDLEVNVYEIKNNYFGESITVSGLLTGVDMLDQLKDKDLGSELLIPENTLKADESMFLCNMTPDELSAALRVKITPCPNDGAELLRCILGV